MGVKTDISAMQARVKATQRAVAVAGRSAVVAAGDALVDAIERIAPYDTNRYIRGWQLAIQAAGSGVEGAKTRQVKALKESRFMAQNFDRLDRQVKRLEKARSGLVNRLQKWFYGTGRPLGKWGRRAEAKVAQLDKLIVRAKVQRRLIDDDEGTALVIGRGYGRRLTTVRTKVYGGTGRSFSRGGRASLYLRNLEPHASIVESNSRVVEKAVSLATPQRVMFRTFAERMRVLAGTSVGGGGRAVSIEL
mgnify:CR=1 FL=1